MLLRPKPHHHTKSLNREENFVQVKIHLELDAIRKHQTASNRYLQTNNIKRM